jgi:hypothetical protein
VTVAGQPVRLKLNFWETAAGAGSLAIALISLAAGHLIIFLIAATVFAVVFRRVAPRYVVFWLFARHALARVRLGRRAVLDTLALGFRMDTLFTPILAAERLKHERHQAGWPYVTLISILRNAAGAHRALRKLSFYSTADTLALAEPLESLLLLGQKLDQIDASLIRSSEGKATSLLTTQLTSFAIESPWLGAESSQSMLELDYASRSGPDGEWFRRGDREARGATKCASRSRRRHAADAGEDGLDARTPAREGNRRRG